jgi:hypothetical protein
MTIEAQTATTAAPPVVETPAAPPAAPQAPAQVEISLAEYIADRARIVQENARNGRPEPAAEPGKVEAQPAAVATPALAVAVVEPAKEEPAKPAEVAPTEAKPEDKDKPAEPSRAKELSDFVKLQRANRAESQRLKAEREAFQAERTALEAEKVTTTASKAEVDKFEREFAADPVTAVMRRLGSEKFKTEFLLSALERAGKDEALPEVVMTEAERTKLIEESAAAKALEKLRAEQKATEDAKTSAAEKRNAEAQEKYFTQIGQTLTANAAKYPNMAEEGWDTKEMVTAIEQHVAQTGQWPTADMVLTHFEAKHVARAEKYAKRMGLAKPAEAPKPTPGMAPVKAPLDVRGKAATTPDPRTPAQKKAEIEARLEGMRVGA